MRRAFAAFSPARDICLKMFAAMHVPALFSHLPPPYADDAFSALREAADLCRAALLICATPYSPPDRLLLIYLLRHFYA